MEDILIQNSGYSIYYWTDVVLFLIFSITVLYLLLFSLVSLFKNREEYMPAKESSKIAVVILVFDSIWDAKGRAALYKCLISYSNQDYPRDKYKIFVVGAEITQSMQDSLKSMNIEYKFCVDAKFKRTILSHFVSVLDDKESFEFVAIHSIYDRVDPNFLTKVNNALYSGCDVVQTHCKSLHDKSIWNTYKSISDEINNSIFRKAHCRLSLSSALSRTGIIMNLNILEMCLKSKTRVGLEKQFELVLLQNHYYIEYLDYVYTYEEENTRVSTVYNKQHKRYSYYLKNVLRTLLYIPLAMIQGNIDYINKLFQWVLPPRLVLIAIICVFGFLASYIDVFASFKWWVLLTILIVTFIIAVPVSHRKLNLVRVLLMMPIYIVYYIVSAIYKRIR